MIRKTINLFKTIKNKDENEKALLLSYVSLTMASAACITAIAKIILQK